MEDKKMRAKKIRSNVSLFVITFLLFSYFFLDAYIDYKCYDFGGYNVTVEVVKVMPSLWLKRNRSIEVIYQDQRYCIPLRKIQDIQQHEFYQGQKLTAIYIPFFDKLCYKQEHGILLFILLVPSLIPLTFLVRIIRDYYEDYQDRINAK